MFFFSFVQFCWEVFWALFWVYVSVRMYHRCSGIMAGRGGSDNSGERAKSGAICRSRESQRGGVMAAICFSETGACMASTRLNFRWSGSSICRQPMDSVWHSDRSQGSERWVCLANSSGLRAWPAIDTACKTLGHQNHQHCTACRTEGGVEGTRCRWSYLHG